MKERFIRDLQSCSKQTSRPWSRYVWPHNPDQQYDNVHSSRPRPRASSSMATPSKQNTELLRLEAKLSERESNISHLLKPCKDRINCYEIRNALIKSENDNSSLRPEVNRSKKQLHGLAGLHAKVTELETEHDQITKSLSLLDNVHAKKTLADRASQVAELVTLVQQASVREDLLYVLETNDMQMHPRKADSIVSYMEKRAHPVVTIITSDNHTDSTKTGIFAEAKRYHYVFGVCYNHSPIKEVSSLSQGSLVLWKKFDEGCNDFHGEKLAQESITKFVITNSVSLFDELTPANFALYSELGLPLAYTFIEANNPKREQLVKSFEPVAKDHKGHVNFVWIDATKFGDYTKSLNLPGSDWPEFVIQDLSNQDKFPLEPKKDVNKHNVAEFIKLMSAHTFEDVVYANNNHQDVFLEFYGPWCGHCKLLKPIWYNLSRSSSDKVLIAKSDATENDIPSTAGIQVQGYPTLKFKPAGSREFIDYDDEEELDAMIAFVEKTSVNKVKAVKVELPEPVEGGEGGDQVVFDFEESEPVPEDEDKDAEHDEFFLPSPLLSMIFFFSLHLFLTACQILLDYSSPKDSFSLLLCLV
ncbi:hypothetical protein Pst134EB_016860 [Puccinia striiformis f. sp. tritici]|nr:hypothetical protein Pst134EB_016860 [Puccinia striiformis f. sp. tritici]